jgi:serine/threonine protein kinase
LYEATFGKAPFATDHLLHLIKKVSYEKIFWPSKKDGRPKITKFLQGLLEKDPKKRIVWHDILHHNYFSSESKILECRKSESEFTMELTESQELAKEIQRQEKAKKLPGYNRAKAFLKFHIQILKSKFFPNLKTFLNILLILNHFW